MPDNYQVKISTEIDDPAWDTFIQNSPHGHYAQSSLWAHLKAFQGWQTRRIIITTEESIVGGMQILVKPVPLFGSLGGYLAQVPKGPVLPGEDSSLVQIIMDELRRIAKKQRIQYMLLQPPDDGHWLDTHLNQHGFRPADANVLFTASLVIDLSQDLESIQKQIKSKVRYNIRLAERKDITVREGTENDLPIFARLLEATRERQGFFAFDEETINEMWRIFSPHDTLKLFFAEYESDPIAAVLAIRYKDTLFRTMPAWSGLHKERMPNVLLDWKTITWAKEHGLRYFDFAGIDPGLAQRMLDGETTSRSNMDGVKGYNLYKVGFGGKPMLYPVSYQFVYNPLLRRLVVNLLQNKRIQGWIEKIRRR